MKKIKPTFLTVAPDTQISLPGHGTIAPSTHVFDKSSILALNAALASGRPLLVRGDPGTGKSQLARAAAVALDRALVPMTLDSQTEPRDLLWTLDAIARLAEAGLIARRPPGNGRNTLDSLNERLYLRPGPLWWAFNWLSAQETTKNARVKGLEPYKPERWEPSQGVVLLLDEIDKADSAVPNGLLEALGQGRFEAPGHADGVSCGGEQPPPLVVVTTNEERTLPDAFLRRCFVLRIELPQHPEELVTFLVRRGRAHFSECKVLEEVARQVVKDRAAVKDLGLVPPGQAEYLDLLRALTELRPDDPKEQSKLLSEIAGFALRKHPESKS